LEATPDQQFAHRSSRMPRSATDATRFTSTTPHATAKQPLPSNLGQASRAVPPRTPGPAGETPQQRVKRLKEAAARSRNANISNFDKIVDRGRVWADRAHRITTLSLIAATGLAGIFTVYAIGDMIIWNRKKKAQYFQEQKALQEQALWGAQKAIQSGNATEEQIELVQLEAKYQAEKRARETTKGPGILTRVKELLFANLKKEEEGEDYGTSEARLGYEATNEEDDYLGERESDIIRAIEEKRLGIVEKAKKAFEKEKSLHKEGGPLDRIGTETATSNTPDTAASQDGKGWLGFLSRN